MHLLFFNIGFDTVTNERTYMISSVAYKGYDFAYLNLSLKKVQAYIFTALFVVGNLALPYMCHAIPNGGIIFLPIFFFTLIASYKFGWRVGLLTAIASPLANNLLFGMPASAMLLNIVGTSLLIVLFASLISLNVKKISLLSIAAVVISYQFVNVLISFIAGNSLQKIAGSIQMSVPGLLIQVIVGYAVLVALRGYGHKES